MKNIEDENFDFSSITLDKRKYLGIDWQLTKKITFNTQTNKQKLLPISSDEISIEPFWEDDLRISTNKLEVLQNLESEVLKEYVKLNPSFGIFVREEVKDKLLLISNNLKSLGYILVIKIGYRPREVQEVLFQKIYNYFQGEMPGKSKSEIYSTTREYISDPNSNISPHLTGGAVDVILKDLNGNIVDMGCKVNHIGPESYYNFSHLTEAQSLNRDILFNEFTSNGFASLSSEWWHFSYGDSNWAKFYNHKKSLYGEALL